MSPAPSRRTRPPSRGRVPRAGDIDRKIGALIRAAREARGLPQEDLGDGVGVRASQIGKYETGSNRVSAARLWSIAGVLGVPVETLFPRRCDAPSRC